MAIAAAAVIVPLGLLFFLSGLVINLLQAICFLLIRPLFKNVYRRINRVVAELMWLELVWIIDWWASVKDTMLVGSYHVTEESLMDRLSTNMHEACLQIDKECRVLTVHGSADEVIAVEDTLEFDKIIPNHKLHIVEGANHN